METNQVREYFCIRNITTFFTIYIYVEKDDDKNLSLLIQWILSISLSNIDRVKNL